MKHRCHKICINYQCEIPNPFICDICNSHHSNTCQIITYKQLVKKLHKNQGLNRSDLIKYQQMIEQTFSILMKSLRQQFILFRQMFQHMNASKAITEFYQAIKSHKQGILTGKKIKQMINQQLPKKKDYILKPQATLWTLGNQIIQLQKKVNTKLPYYYTIKQKDKNNQIYKQIDLDFAPQHPIKKVQMRFRKFRQLLVGGLLKNDISTFQDHINQNIFNIQLLYRASQHKFSAHIFHQKCDGKNNTVVLAKTQFGNIVGGFNPLPWKSSNNWQYVTDPQNLAFLFSFNKYFQNKKFQPYKKQFTIAFHKDYGPCFGDDLVIYDKSSTSKNCWSNFPDCYRCKSKDFQHNSETIKQFVGVDDHFKKFNIIEWQVYKVSFSKEEEQQPSFYSQYRKI